ncbi:S8 family peptidase [Paenibacillus radicis (ex Xue et al. 2023)]|uniref:S8 family peptidase n=1 Tax=Paenibacillus radicis (ex Xue et al. 2023) TaxID=2972489 RepID=A0ABT1YP97_9BACL|nr:S8 family peptidase [Paenibacillus radicis (ex Xue et al. 2023)]MCR8635006.1 S8 family peptidase [Paenibacillus radicis (ex Xue et al. 2023)]
MWKYVLTFVFVIALGTLLFPRGGNEPQYEGLSLSPTAEMQMKHATLKQDMQLTADLCRSQCSLELQRMLLQKNGESAAEKLKGLQELQKEHPHMEQLIWVTPEQSVDHGISVGGLNDETRTVAVPELRKAKAATDRGSSYQSPALSSNGETYFVLGVPSTQAGSGLLGVVKQSIVKHVEDHQLKNLRIVTYPNEGKYKVESVDSRTLEDVKVDHPEQNEGTSHYTVNQVVVRFKKEPTPAELAQIQSEIRTTRPHHKLGYTYVFESEHMEAKQLMNYFQKWNVEYAEPHFLYLTNTTVPSGSAESPVTPVQDTSTITPNDSLYRRYQWNLPLIETELGWDISKGSKDVIVAVVDTGVDMNHPDLKNQLIEGINVVNTGALPLDDVGHGTHVAGVIGAIVNNNLGVAGMSWYNRVMPIKVLDQTGAGSTYAVAQGIIWATDHGAKVINMSLGNYADANFLHDAIRYAYDHDVVLIAASGNDNTDRPGFPAAYPEVFAVAAADANKNKASFSNYGDYIDVAAPGVSIASTYPNNQYAALSGTSMASPHVTALAALIRSVNPALKNQEVMQIMRDTAQDVGPKGKDNYFGYGLIDVAAALKSAKGVNETTKAHENVSLDNPSWTQRFLDLFHDKYSK